MSTLSELIKEHNSLPKGNIYKKVINGKTYYYHQYFYNGKRYSKKLKENDVEEFKTKINRRLEVEELIQNKKDNERKLTLSKSLYNLTGQVMSGNTPVAKFKDGKLHPAGN